MKRDFDGVAAGTFDIIIIGGGIIGAGIAHDATLRGFSTLLVEKEDFGCGTTSRSSRLIHGGLRYLRQLQLGLVHQDLRERDVLLHIAPHLVHPMRFVIPLTSGDPLQRLVLPIGLRLYDLLFFRKSLPSHEHLSRRETLQLEPELDLKGLTGSLLYSDCQAPFVERLCLENVIAATEHGAVILNHARVTGFLREGNAVSGVQVQDTLSGQAYQMQGRIVVNATGHWVDTVREMLGKGAPPMIRRTKGIHLLTPQLSRNAVVSFALSDGRLFFVIPWQGYSLIGTTDTDYTGNLDAVEADAADVAYVLAALKRTFPGVKPGDVSYTYAGLRALARSGAGRAGDVSRDHKLVDHERKDGIAGVISVLGGKITAYRAVADNAMNLVCRKLGARRLCLTARAPLPGAPSVSEDSVQRAASEYGLPVETVAHLAELYGSRFSQGLDIVKRDASAGQRLCTHSPDIVAQVRHAVEHEWALTVSDFLLRRSALGLAPCQGLDAAETVAREMGRLLGWSAADQQRQIEAYRVAAAAGQRYRSALDAPVSRG